LDGYKLESALEDGYKLPVDNQVNGLVQDADIPSDYEYVF